jgi:hypothetical protein
MESAAVGGDRPDVREVVDGNGCAAGSVGGVAERTGGVASPGPDGAVLHQREAETVSGGYPSGARAEACYLNRNAVVDAFAAHTVAELAVKVVTPGPDGPVLLERQVVIAAGRDGLDVIYLDPHGHHLRVAVTVTQPPVVAQSPGPYPAILF